MDEFKKHIQQHADEMDFDVPAPGLWDRIETGLETPVKRMPLRGFARFAAAACIILTAGMGAWLFFKKDVTRPPVVVAPPVSAPTTDTIALPAHKKQAIAKAVAQEPLNIVAPVAQATNEQARPRKRSAGITATNLEAEFAAVVNKVSSSFITVVNMQRKELSETPIYGENPNYYSDFKAQFYRLEQEEKDLKRQMARNGAADHGLERLIDIYQQKITILKQLQNEINKTNSRYRSSRPGDSAVSKQFINI